MQHKTDKSKELTALGSLQATTVAPFFRGKDAYKLDEPSEFIETQGYEFFAETITEGGRGIDIGVWSGRHIPFFHKILGDTGQIFGVDFPHPIAQQRLIEAEAKARAKSIVAAFHMMPLANLLFRSNFFDFAVCWRVLHNIINGELIAILREIHRVLKPGAKMLAAVRATKDWMPSYPIPQRFASYLHSGEREDLYFTKEAVRTVFEHFFEIKDMALIEEGETIFDSEGKGRHYLNKYWAIKLLNKG